MSEAILGTIIGGILGLSGTAIVLILEYKKWKRERRYVYLKELRERHEKLFSEVYQKLMKAMLEGLNAGHTNLPMDLMSDIEFRCPEIVREAASTGIEKWTNSKERLEAGKECLALVDLNMKKWLSELDELLAKEIGVKLMWVPLKKEK